MADRTVKVTLKAEIAKYLADLRKAGKSTEDLGSVIDSAGKRSAQAFAALPAVAATAGAATAAALGAAGTAFIGLGAVALRNNTEVRQSFEDLSTTINQGLAQDAAPLADAFVGAADDIGSAYQRLRPELQDAFAASVPYVEDLTAGVIGFAENAMPGVVDAVESAGPVFDGLRSMMEDTGTATGEFFSILSEHSEEAGQGVEHLGSIVSGVLPNTATIIGNLTDAWASHGDEVADVLTQLTGIIADISSGSLPVLSSAVGVAVEALSAVLDVVEPMAGVIGPLVGTWLSLAAAMKGVQAVRGIMQAAGASVAAFADRTKKAGRTAKIASGAFAALALAGAGMESAFGKDAAADIEAFTLGLERWARQGELSGEVARVFGGDVDGLSEAFSNLGHWARPATDVLAGFAEIVPGVDTYMTTATKKVDALDTSLATMVENGNGQLAAEVFQKVAKVAAEAGVPMSELREMLPEYSAAQEVAANKTKSTGEALAGSVPGAEALTEAMKTLSETTGTTADRVDALNTAWKQLFGIEIGLEEATANWEEGLDTLSETISGVKEDTKNWKNELFKANGTLDLSTEAGRKLSENLIAQGEDYRGLAQTVYDTTLKRTGSEQAATQAVQAAASKRRKQFISEKVEMGFTEAQARDLANRYLGMPGEVETLITQPGMDGAMANADNLRHLYNQIPESVSTTVTTIFTSRGTGFGAANRALSGAGINTGATGGLVTENGIIPGYAPGGMVRGPGSGTSDSIPALLSNGEFVINAKATAQHRELLQAINSGAFRGSPSFSGGSSGSSGVVNNFGGVQVKSIGPSFSTKQVMEDLAMHSVS